MDMAIGRNLLRKRMMTYNMGYQLISPKRSKACAFCPHSIKQVYIIIQSTKIKFNNNVCRNLSPYDTIEFQGSYKISSIDLNQKELTTIITADSDETKPISEKILIYSNTK